MDAAIVGDQWQVRSMIHLRKHGVTVLEYRGRNIISHARNSFSSKPSIAVLPTRKAHQKRGVGVLSILTTDY